MFVKKTDLFQLCRSLLVESIQSFKVLSRKYFSLTLACQLHENRWQLQDFFVQTLIISYPLSIKGLKTQWKWTSCVQTRIFFCPSDYDALLYSTSHLRALSFFLLNILTLKYRIHTYFKIKLTHQLGLFK